MENCAIGLDPVMKLAEKHNIMIQMELLNSKVDHADYQCDKSPWGVALVEKIGENARILHFSRSIFLPLTQREKGPLVKNA